jgi:hypothetical protein
MPRRAALIFYFGEKFRLEEVTSPSSRISIIGTDRIAEMTGRPGAGERVMKISSKTSARRSSI